MSQKQVQFLCGKFVFLSNCVQFVKITNLLHYLQDCSKNLTSKRETQYTSSGISSKLPIRFDSQPGYYRVILRDLYGVSYISKKSNGWNIDTLTLTFIKPVLWNDFGPNSKIHDFGCTIRIKKWAINMISHN